MKEEKKNSGPGVHSLPDELWPAADRASWQEACRPSVRLKRGGAASHLKPVVQHDLAKRYGLFLDCLSRSGGWIGTQLRRRKSLPENVATYVTELKGRVSSVTVYGSIQKLRRFVQLIAPDRDLGWLIDIERELYSEMRPRSKWDRVVSSDVLVDAGLTLMTEAEIAKAAKTHPRPNVPQRPNDRAARPLSDPPEELTALEMGRSFVNVDGTWWIVLTAAETKEKRPDERPVAGGAHRLIERYLQIYRPILARGNSETNALWLAMDGKPMSYASIAELIPETTRMTIGVAVNPHLFRTAAVTTLATRLATNLMPAAPSCIISLARLPRRTTIGRRA